MKKQKDRDKQTNVYSILIAGGGTGGHVLAGIAIADAWSQQWKELARVQFVGAHGGMEEKLVAKTQYSLLLLKLGSLNRVSLSRRLKTFLQLPIALMKAAWILIQFKPKHVLGVGGYASGPIVLMARILRFVWLYRGTVSILEQNSIPGFTNRILGRMSDFVFTAFPGCEKRFPKKNVIFTGNPIRSTIQPMPPAERDPFIIFIFGGSQGAIGINTLVLSALPYLKSFKGQLRFVHQTGEKDYPRVLKGYQDVGLSATVEKFIHNMPEIYASASLIICRSGASTLAEIAATGRASILIPLPTAADNHQEENARIFEKAGAAKVLRQNEVQGAELAAEIEKLYQQQSELRRMEVEVKNFFRPHAAMDLVQKLIDINRLN